tara:strand:- start:1939 stop:3048 length:1110 start_codon:yes stop_codon:yes gene_type:complete
MANTIKIKRNTSDSDEPTTSNIAQGELAFTEATQILFYRDSSDNIRKIGGEGAFLRSDTNDTMSGNLTVTGNLTVNGTTTEVNSTTVTVDDPLIHFAQNNSADSVDIGFFGKYVESSTTKYAGLVRDASDSGKFILFAGNEAAPDTTVNTSGTGHSTATLKANIEGNISSPTITSATIATQLDMNGTELILDADADTSIHASSDDQIDIKIGGNDELKLTATAFSPATNAGQDLGTSSLKFSNLHINSAVNTATISASGQITSTLADGTKPFVITSTTVVDNLNADMLDGKHAPSSAIVGLTDTQTLSNKTLTLPQINDTSADHQYVFAVSELTADRTVTLPLLAGNDTFVFADFQQTLDNKTIDGGTF